MGKNQKKKVGKKPKRWGKNQKGGEKLKKKKRWGKILKKRWGKIKKKKVGKIKKGGKN